MSCLLIILHPHQVFMKFCTWNVVIAQNNANAMAFLQLQAYILLKFRKFNETLDLWSVMGLTKL